MSAALQTDLDRDEDAVPQAHGRWKERRTVARTWVERGLWAVLDQGFFATANFALGVLLARWLHPGQFGAFTLAYSILLLFGTAHTSLLTEPLLVFGSGRHRDDFPSYLRSVLRAHWLLCSAGSVLLLLSGAALLLAGRMDVGAALAGAGVAAPFVLLSWLLRRACFAQLRPKWAAVAASVYLVVTLVCAFALQRSGRLGPLSAMLVIGAAALIASALHVASPAGR